MPPSLALDDVPCPRPRVRAPLAAALAAALAACGPPATAPDAAVTGVPDAASMPDASGPPPLLDVPATPRSALDVLLVVDDSYTMLAKQGELGAGLPTFLDELGHAPGGLPDLHIGVISTNLGLGGVPIARCEGAGEDGHMLVGDGTCTVTAGAAFLVDVAGAGGARVRNFTAEPGDVLACVTRLGNAGCGIEQPYAALRRALDPATTANAGFLRPDAALGIIVVSDEDDCSASDTAIFDPAVDPTVAPDFQCALEGMTCEQDLRTAGPHTGCRPRDDSRYLEPIATTRDFLRALKSDPGDVVVVDLGGPAAPVEILPPAPPIPGPSVGPSCQEGSASATPAVRRAALTASLPRHVIGSICEPLLGTLTRGARQMRAALGDTCLPEGAQLLDTEPGTSGLQPACTVTEVSAAGAHVVPACAAAAGATPCWTLAPDVAGCGSSPGFLRLRVDRGGAAAPAGARVQLTCTPAT